MMSAATWPCIGRSTQSALIAALLRDPAPRALIVAGPAGSGKTHLVNQCASAARAEGIAIRVLDSARWGLVAVDRAEAPEAVEGRMHAPAGGSPRPTPIRKHTSSLVTVVEDVQQLDEHSARTLYTACAERTGSWVFTMRTGDQIPAPMVAMWADGLADRVDLPPLSRAEIDEVLVGVLGGQVDESMTTRLMHRCQGNLLYLRELVLDAVAEGVIFEDGGLWRATGEWRTPPRLAEIVAASLQKLNATQRATLETVAFAGSLGSAELDALVHPDDVEALERLKLVRTTMEGRRLRVQVGDPILAEVLVNDMPGIRARALARRLAELVEATGCRREDDILKVAMWRLSGGGGSPATLLAGANAARSAHKFSLAQRLVRLAIAEGAGFDAELLAAKLIGLQGDDRECQQALLELAAHTVTEDQQAQVRLALDEHQAIWMGLSSRVATDGAEAHTAVGSSELNGQLRATRAGTLLLTDGPRAARAEATALLADPQNGVRTWAAIVLGYSLARVGRTQDALEVSAAGLTTHTQLEWFSGWDRWWHAFNRCEALSQAGRLTEACTLARTRYEAALTSPSPEEQAFFGWQLCTIHTQLGTLTTAAHYGKVAAALFRDLGRSAYVQAARVSLALAWARAGHVTEASRLLADLDRADSPIVSVVAVDDARARGWIAANTGDRAGAREHLWNGQRLGAGSGDLAAEAAALHDLVVLGDTSVAGRLRELDAQSDSALVAARTRHAEAASAKDPELLSQASHGFARLGAALAAAEAAADAAVRWRQRGQPRRAAGEERRAHELLSTCEGAHAFGVEAIGARAVLSPGEHETAALAVTGRSNGQIADTLQLSKRTVENRLQRVYSKLGITGRDDLADALGVGFTSN